MPEAPPAYYDAVFTAGKYELGRASYWNWAVRTLTERKASGKGIDVGCGPGGFLVAAGTAGFAIDGIDFSPEAVRQASARTERKVFHADLWTFPKWREYDFFTVLETLEHVEADLDFLQLLPEGRLVVGSVPSWGDPSHVRTFPNLQSVITRYSGLFNDFHAEEILRGLWGFHGFLCEKSR